MKVQKDAVYHRGRVTVKKKLEDGHDQSEDVFGCVCACGARIRLTRKQIHSKRFPHDCGVPPLDDGSGTEIVVAGTGDVDKRQRLVDRLEKINSVFKEDVIDIQTLMQSQDSDTAILRFHKGALMTLVELIPIAEEKYRKFGNERAAYALGALISQAREIITDIKAETDQQRLGIRLASDIVQPAFLMIMQNMVDNMYQLKKGIEHVVEPQHVKEVHQRVDGAVRAITHYLEQSYMGIRDRLVEEMTD